MRSTAFLDALRARIAAIEHAPARGPVLPFGVPAIDAALPGGGLASGALHELSGSVALADDAAATVFLAGVLARTSGVVVWCLRWRDLFAPALGLAGLCGSRVIFVEAGSDTAVLIAMEEGLRHAGLAAVVGEVARLPLTASRRLQLAAETSGVPAFVLRRAADRKEGGEGSAAVTRWSVRAAPSERLAIPALARARWEVALTLDLFFHCVDGQSFALRAGTAAPTRDAAHIVKLLLPRIDMIDAGLGIEAMTLAARLVEPLALRQTALVEGAMRGPDLGALVDTLANRFGARRLYRLGSSPSAMPERTVALLPALGPDVPAPFAADLPRPARLLAPPEPIAVTAMLPDHPPAMFVWRRTRHRVVAADGPERLHGEWWREGGREADTPFTVRDYFQVETEGGGRYWIFRLGDGEWPASGPMRWYLHGAFA